MQTFDSAARYERAPVRTTTDTLIDLVGPLSRPSPWFEDIPESLPDDPPVEVSGPEIMPVDARDGFIGECRTGSGDAHSHTIPAPTVAAGDLRVRSVRLLSAAKIAMVFHAVLFASLVATAVVVWNVVRALGFVAGFEEMMVTSLGLESFEVAGGQLFGVVVAGAAAVAVVGFALTMLALLIYNAASLSFGGVVVDLDHRRSEPEPTVP